MSNLSSSELVQHDILIENRDKLNSDKDYLTVKDIDYQNLVFRPRNKRLVDIYKINLHEFKVPLEDYSMYPDIHPGDYVQFIKQFELYGNARYVISPKESFQVLIRQYNQEKKILESTNPILTIQRFFSDEVIIHGMVIRIDRSL